MNMRRFLMLAPAVAACSLGAHAMDLAPRGAFVTAGVAAHGTYTVSGGVVWPWSWRREAWGGELTGLTEGYVSHWSARDVSERQSFAQLGLVPLVRYRFSRGHSGWFVEGGIGLSVTDKVYRTPDKQFSTRFNFVDTAGVGLSLGAQRQHEVGLRVVHMSNAGIKKPNPGENFLQLRYAASF
jgi:lipid A 3-O-deacylase